MSPITARCTSCRASSGSRRSSSTPTRTSVQASSTCPSSRCTRRRTGWRFRSTCSRRCPYATDDRRDGIFGLAFAMKQIATLLLMCDGHDVGLSINAGAHAAGCGSWQLERCRTAIRRAFSSTTLIQAASASASRCSRCTRNCSTRTRELIAECPCENGCPSCVGPVGQTGPLAKTVALRILDHLTGIRLRNVRPLETLAAAAAPAAHLRHLRHPRPSRRCRSSHGNQPGRSAATGGGWRNPIDAGPVDRRGSGCPDCRTRGATED